MDISELDEPAHDGLARAEAIGAADHEVEGEVPRHAISDALEQSAPRRLRRTIISIVRPAPSKGLFVHDRAEAEYFSTYEDGDAQLLDGANQLCRSLQQGRDSADDEERLLVLHDVWRRFPAGEESDRPVLDRRPHQGSDLQSRRLARHLHPARAAGGPRGQLAALARRAACSESIIASICRRKRPRIRRRSANICRRSRRPVESRLC